ncbi:uncharacterized protein LOC102452260 isoform X2 [Pelodiscus sinensis]|uniref:uncharacterized protein LOC102452260 isoform X2 n=1 Tax=Pelodiscus sinensis TaxID=13735 RepID=UPI003F6B6241
MESRVAMENPPLHRPLSVADKGPVVPRPRMSEGLARRKVGIVGFGHLGQYLVQRLQDEGAGHGLELGFVWNRDARKLRGQVPASLQLQDLSRVPEWAVDLIVEVAHPCIAQDHGEAFLSGADFMVGSPTALADQATETRLRDAARRGGHTLYVPRGALWGGEDIQRMDQRGLLQGLTVTMVKHPESFRLEGALRERLQAAGAGRAVLYEGPVRALCPLAPNNVNTMAAACVAAPSLGFDGVRGCLIADPGQPSSGPCREGLRRPPGGAMSGGPEPGIYHERQRLELCAVHALNNVLQERLFTQEAADEICKRLAPDARLNPHRSVLGTGNYDVNVIMAALHSLDLAAIWWDKRRPLEQLVLSRIHGFIVNVPSNVALGFVTLPVRRKHWIAVRQVGGVYYNLDSKLKAPDCVGGESELRAFLQGFLSQGPCEVLLVVSRAVEETGAWLNPE